MKMPIQILKNRNSPPGKPLLKTQNIPEYHKSNNRKKLPATSSSSVTDLESENLPHHTQSKSPTNLGGFLFQKLQLGVDRVLFGL